MIGRNIQHFPEWQPWRLCSAQSEKVGHTVEALAVHGQIYLRRLLHITNPVPIHVSDADLELP
jgi:hypothetical protein